MGTTYFVQTPQELLTLVRAHPTLPQQTIVGELADPGELLNVVRCGDQTIDIITLGPNLAAPVQIAQQIHRVDNQISLLLLSEPAQFLSIKHALQFTPLLGREVQCLSFTETSTIVAAIQAAVERAIQRRSYTAHLKAASQQMAEISLPQPSASEYLGRLLDYAPVGIATLDHDGCVVGWNRMASLLFGKTERDVLGTSYVALFPPHERKPVQTIVDECKIVAGATSPRVVRASAEDDRVVSLQIRAAALPLRANTLGALLLFEDVTARILAEHEREVTRQRLTFLAELSPILASSLDFETTVWKLARAVIPSLADWCAVDTVQADDRLARVAVAAVEAQHERSLRGLQEQYPPPWETRQRAADALQHGKGILYPSFEPQILSVQHDHAYLRLVQELHPQSALVVPLMLRERLLGVLTLGYSHGSRRYTEEDLRFAEEVGRRAAIAIENARLYAEAQNAIQLRDQFLSLASHELKTPLTSMLGNIQLFRRRVSRDQRLGEREQHPLQVIEEQTKRLHKMVLSLLDISRIETGQLALEPQPINVCAVVHRVMDEIQAMLPERQIQVECETHSLIVQADELRLEQVFHNLIQNAAKYSDRVEPIDVVVGQRGQQVYVAVRDRGIGIPRSALPHVFERFYRAGNVDPGKISGMGIGLHVVKQIVELHGGEVTVQSIEGEGTTVTVSLPLDATSSR